MPAEFSHCRMLTLVGASVYFLCNSSIVTGPRSSNLMIRSVKTRKQPLVQNKSNATYTRSQNDPVFFFGCVVLKN